MRPIVGKIVAIGLTLSGACMISSLTLAEPNVAVAQDLTSSGATIPSGPSFRVETELFVGDKVQPAARHLTLFDSGVIYDFRLDDDRFVTLFDPTRGRVILVDRRKLEQTVVNTADLLQVTAQLRAAVTQEGKADRFGVNAVVAPASDVKPGDLSAFEISFGDTRYRTTTQPVTKPEIARAYNHFATLAAQLNVLQSPGTLAPPFARMTLGQHIADAGLLPLETVLEVKKENRILKDRYRSHLLVIEQLSNLDRNRIAEFGKLLATCQQVELASFGK